MASKTQEVKDENLELKVEPEKVKRVFNSQPLRSINDIVEDLHKDIHSKYIRTRKQGGTEISYITWYDCTKYLDLFAPGWSYEVRSIEIMGDNVVMIARISIPSAEGIFHRDATGYESVSKGGYGDPFSNSESMALRRAAAKFGLGQHLYRDK